MSGLVVRPVTSSRDRKQFLHLPWSIYRGDRHWIPPLRSHQRDLAGFQRPWVVGGGRHPFYEKAESQAFLALRDGEPCGRIMAIVNHAHNEWQKEERGFFGFFETVDDREVAHGLLGAARQWLGDRGIDAIRGPMNPSQNYECGLLVEGFDTPPFFMMTYNPDYYGTLIESYGFRKTQDLYAYWGHVEMLSTVDKKLAFITEAATERFGIRLRQLDTSRFREDVELFLKIFNESMTGSWGFVPLSMAETRDTAAALRHLIVPELTMFAEIEGRTVGSVFGFLDYNTAIREIDGRLFPFGFLRLLRGRRRIQRIRLISTAVLPAYQRWGIGLVLLAAILPNVLDWGIQEAEFSWVLESNRLSRGGLEKGGAKRTKTYRLYDYPAPLGPVTARPS